MTPLQRIKDLIDAIAAKMEVLFSSIPTKTSELVNDVPFLEGGSFASVAFSGDYEDLINKNIIKRYDNIALLLANQTPQNTQVVYIVEDASADSNIIFASGVTNFQAAYNLKSSTKTGSINDYILVSTPYGNGGTGVGGGKVDSVTGDGVSGTPENVILTFPNLNELDTTVTGAELDAIKVRVDGLEIGGRNLFYAGLESGQWGVSTGEKVSNSSRLRCKQLISVKPDTPYIITNYSASGSYIYLLAYGVGGAFITYVGAQTGQYRFTTDADTYYITFYVDISTGASINDLIKVEKGTIATDWTPAPEDQVTDWDITDVKDFRYLKNKGEKFTTTLKNKLDSITAIFTTALKTAYDDAVTWISTNGATLLAHLSLTNNPHNVTKPQVISANSIEVADMAKMPPKSVLANNAATPEDAQYLTVQESQELLGINTKQPKDLTYPTIADMIAAPAQAVQVEGVVIRVDDASADTRITFPTGNSKVAYYQKLSTSTATLSTDYTLIGSAFGIINRSKNLTLGVDKKIDMSNPFINLYNFDSPSSVISLLTENSVIGGKAIIRVNANTASNPSTVTVNGSNTGRICDIVNWIDNVDMEIYLQYTVNGLEWWYYTKKR